MNIVLAILTVYCSLILFLIFKYISVFNHLGAEDFPDKVSVVVAYRNEEKNLDLLIQDLLLQDHSLPYEIILVNDHSSDASQDIVNQHSDPRIVSLSLPDDLIGKKNALRLGAKTAQGSLLLFTDADCRLQPQWVRLMTRPFVQPGIALVAAPFLYTHTKGFLSFFQNIEQVLLWGFAKSMALISRPVMCNGANMAVRTDKYLQLIDKIASYGPSGDDVFLLQEIKKENASAILYIDHPGVVTSSLPTNRFYTFFNQKIRWASKTGKISDLTMNISGVIFLLFNFYFLYLLLFGFSSLFFIKIFFELFFGFTVYTSQFGKPKSLWQWTLGTGIVLMIYPFYSLSVVFLSKTMSFEWKDRKYLT